MIKKVIACVLLYLSVCTMSFGQVKDSVGVEFSKQHSSENGYDLYEITIANGRTAPIGIMFVPYIKLFYDPPQRLAIYRTTDSCQIVSLHYSERDTHNDYENTNPSYDAEPIMPYQHITFRVYIPDTYPPKKMIFDYIVLRNFCYNDFEQAIFRNSSTWYDGYAIKHVTFDLPR
jgi:hypothetical protein